MSDDAHLWTNKVIGIGQMDSGSTDFEAVVKVEADSTTRFLEAGDTIEVSGKSTVHNSTYIEELSSIKAFLGKPFLLQSLNWNTQVANSNLYSFDISTTLGSVPAWGDKIRGFNLIKGDFVVKLALNASPFQQGKLLLHYLPCYKQQLAANAGIAKMKNLVLSQKYQHPHVELSCRDTSVALKIPYIAPSAYYALAEGSYDWGTVFIDVFSALATGPSAPVGQAYADVSVYGYWENIELQVPIVPQSSSEERVIKRGGLVSEEKEEMGPIASSLKRVGKATSILSKIPILGDFMSPISWAANIFADSAGALGWSKPRQLEGIGVVTKSQFRYAGTTDGPNLAYPGGITCLNRVELYDQGSITNEDEMSFEFLFKVPLFMGEFPWSWDSGIGTSLQTQKMGPDLLAARHIVSDTVAGHTAEYEYQVPFTALSKIFTLWRGSFCLMLKFVKTQMHSGRLQVTWTPCSNVTNTPNLLDSMYSLRTVIDIRTEDVVCIELPYLLYKNYTETGSYSGQLDIQVLNDLRAPESCSQTIAVQWFIVPGNDFELAVPKKSLYSTLPYIPQSSNEEAIIGSRPTGMLLDDFPIGNKKVVGDSLFHSLKCIGERVLSIKQLLLRQTRLYSYSGPVTTWSNKAITVDPWATNATGLNAAGFLQSGALGGDMLTYFKGWYAFHRGSVNFSMAGTTNNFNSSDRFLSQIQPQTADLAGVAPIIDTSATMAFSSVKAVVGSSSWQGQSVNVHENDGSFYIHVPYYCKFPMSLTTYYEGISTPGTEESKPLSLLSIFSPASQNAYTVNRSVGDDYQLMYFTGCLPLVRTYV